mgnify:CR=1 FL=1
MFDKRRTLEKALIIDMFTPITCQYMTQVFKSTSHVLLSEPVKDGTQTTKIIVLMTMNEMNMNYLNSLLRHNYTPFINT